MSEDLPEGDMLAAEYALGVLGGEARMIAARRAADDPAFAHEVEVWQGRLAGLAAFAAPVAPPAGLWTSVQRRLDGGAEPAGEVVLLKLRRSVARWRGATAAAAGLAACLLLALAWPRVGPAPPPMLTARLSASAQGPAVFVALYDPARRAIVLTPATVSAAAGRSPELWLIPTGGKPVPLGVADFADTVKLVSNQAGARLGAGVLAVSVEPKGGSPSGQPTGPVIATGQLSQL